MSREIVLQIICVTYNQREYIAEALDSFLMQKTNFSFEVLVGDDCSTDGTSNIVAAYSKKYPRIIKHIHRKSNMGCLENFMDLCERASAKYVAFCDGDDYWTDENKLQMQFDFLEQNTDVKICAHKTFIKAEKSWCFYDFYKSKKEPFILPYKHEYEKKLDARDMTKDLCHMSSFFVRWSKIFIPDWAKTGGVSGDFSIILIQLCEDKIYILNKVLSVYRRGCTGVVNANGTMYEQFLNTRKEYFKIFSGLIDYFNKNCGGFCVKEMQERMELEAKNYLNTIIEHKKWYLLQNLKKEYFHIYEYIIKQLSTAFYKQKLQKIFNTLPYLLRVKEKMKFHLATNLFFIKSKFSQKNSVIGKYNYIILSFLAYWIFALVPKNKKIWVFSGFFQKSYMDNTKYLFEYIVKNNPEIKVVWLTKNQEIYEKLKSNALPVLKSNSLKGIMTMSRAAVAFSDHFRMSDYENIHGYNARTKFVNLWHGTGFKSMIPIGNKIPNTTIQGVMLSDDIISNKYDNILIKIKKKIKYIFLSSFRELFEKYFKSM